MHAWLVRLGPHRMVNMNFCIDSHEWDGTPKTQGFPPGGFRVTVYPGRAIDLEGIEADHFRQVIATVPYGAPPLAPSAVPSGGSMTGNPEAGDEPGGVGGVPVNP